MSVAMIYLNPNISKEDADKIYNDYLDRRKKMSDEWISAMEKCEDKKQLNRMINAYTICLMALG